MTRHEIDENACSLAQSQWQKDQGSSLTGPLWRRKWLFLAVLTMCVLAGAAYCYLAKPVYVSTAKLYIQPASVHTSNDVATPPLSANFLNTQCELIKSRAVIEAAMQSPRSGQLSLLRSQDDPADAFSKSVEAGVGKRHDIILVSVRSGDPREAAGAANLLVETYVAYLARQQRSLAGGMLNVLAGEKALRDQELADAQQAVVEFKRDNGDVTFDNDKNNVVLQRLCRLTDALTSAEIESLQARTVYEAARSASADPETLRQFCSVYHSQAKLPEAQADQSEARKELSRLELELSDLRRQCTEDHPSVKNALARVQELQSGLERQDGNLTAAVMSALGQIKDSALKAEGEIRQSLEEQRKLAAQFNVKTCEYAMLQSRLQRADALCGTINSRIKELRPAENASAVAVSIVEPARAQADPESPVMARTMIACAFIGLVLGLGFALIRDRIDDRLRHPRDIARRLGGCILGAVPAERARRDADQQILDNDWAISCGTLNAVLEHRMKTLRAKIVQVTSPLRGEGKSSLSAGLAAASAASGKSTILVDASGAAAVQHDLLRATCGQGLAGVMEGKVGLLEAVQKTSIDRLDILTSGIGKDQLARRLGDRQLGTMLNVLARRYDCVIVDTSCVLAGGTARLVAQHTDCVVLALAEGKSSAGSARRAVGSLQSVGARLAGVVITNAQSTHAYDDSLTLADVQESQTRRKQAKVAEAPVELHNG